MTDIIFTNISLINAFELSNVLLRILFTTKPSLSLHYAACAGINTLTKNHSDMGRRVSGKETGVGDCSALYCARL